MCGNGRADVYELYRVTYGKRFWEREGGGLMGAGFTGVICESKAVLYVWRRNLSLWKPVGRYIEAKRVKVKAQNVSVAGAKLVDVGRGIGGCVREQCDLYVGAGHFCVEEGVMTVSGSKAMFCVVGRGDCMYVEDGCVFGREAGWRQLSVQEKEGSNIGSKMGRYV